MTAVPYGRLSYSSYFLALLYLFEALFASVRLRRVASHVSAWSTTKFFLLSLFFQAMLRCLAFVSIIVEVAQDIEMGSGSYLDECATSGGAFDRTFIWFERVMFVLTSLPDFMFLSTYLLLVLVWAELFQLARRHTFPAIAYRKRWTITYLGLNAGLYLTQIVLFAVLFLTPIDACDMANVIKQAIYYTIAGMNVVVPLMVLLFRIFYSLKFAGFPYRSREGVARLRSLTRLVTFWGLGRVAWAALALAQGLVDFSRLSELTCTSCVLVLCLLYRNRSH